MANGRRVWNEREHVLLAFYLLETARPRPRTGGFLEWNGDWRITRGGGACRARSKTAALRKDWEESNLFWETRHHLSATDRVLVRPIWDLLGDPGDWFAVQKSGGAVK
ncbi:hypothetical protein VTN49DRAFT_2240 [Thermomyces lanuginosus]|uniref:uncharacterized protein n=1 Tax=Thermomyces lanuginosus TaxID=5541 RepID=UPI0037445E0C